MTVRSDDTPRDGTAARRARSLASGVLLIGLVIRLGACTQSDQTELDATPAMRPTDDDYQRALERYDECMRADEWTGVDSPTGTIFGAPTAQKDAFLASEERCTTESGLDPDPAPDITDASLEAGYSSLLDMRECLVTNGFEIAAAPTFQRFVELAGAWSPYESLSGIDQIQKAEAVCPQDGF
ncbi:hypothetical protein ESZ53_09830 [Salinibacterium sp. UTAS2018]|uniref:hypothetical protein n=1 Tax=Salinibacterium sp. UTAS2018 TaxID=2508880 RepID=UPI0010094618|nr:hypothetical protein [Salinibacterium sp. UTAS2018]QAV70706.1 hypothetical protein ESZ53_09830 [Salinibacterium sp. UTAS2018]